MEEARSPSAFAVGHGATACTKRAVFQTGRLFGREDWPQTYVMDTPGFCEPGRSAEDIQALIKQEFEDSMRAVDAFVWVVDSGGNPRCTEQDLKCLVFMAAIFGLGFLKNLVVVFTKLVH
jgi:hypothetical protein